MPPTPLARLVSSGNSRFEIGFVSTVVFPADPKDVREIQISIIQFARDFSTEHFMQPLRDLTKAQWDALLFEIERRKSEAADVLTLFGFRMRPDQVALILSFRAVASCLSASYSLLRPFVGIYLADLIMIQDKATRENSAAQRLGYGSCAKHAFTIGKSGHHLELNIPDPAADLPKLRCQRRPYPPGALLESGKREELPSNPKPAAFMSQASFQVKRLRISGIEWFV